MEIFESERKLACLFKLPFVPKKIIYSINSDFFNDSNLSCKIREKQLAIDIDNEDLLHNPLPEFPCGEHGCKIIFTTVLDYEIHYRSAHSIVCSECKKTFPSYNLLDLHIQERHDTYLNTAKNKNLSVFSCIVDGCDAMFSSIDQRNEHVITIHYYPANFKFQELKPHKNVEKMDTTSCDAKLSIGDSCKSRKPVPRNICFGHGSSRAFVRKNKLKSSSTDITMKELADALE